MFLYSYIGVGRPITKEVEDGHGGGSDCKVVGLTLWVRTPLMIKFPSDLWQVGGIPRLLL